MNDLQMKVCLRATIENYIGTLMGENNISPSLVEEALEYVLLHIKDMVLEEYANWAMQDKEETVKQLTPKEEEEVEEE